MTIFIMFSFLFVVRSEKGNNTYLREAQDDDLSEHSSFLDAPARVTKCHSVLLLAQFPLARSSDYDLWARNRID
jgi:hypothetical protein